MQFPSFVFGSIVRAVIIYHRSNTRQLNVKRVNQEKALFLNDWNTFFLALPTTPKVFFFGIHALQPYVSRSIRRCQAYEEIPV